MTGVLFIIFYREADTLAENGAADMSQLVNVTLKHVYFEDYLTGDLTDVTSSWTTNGCSTRSYVGTPSLSAAGTAIDSSCSFSEAGTETALLQSAGMCQGFVKAVYYTVGHASSTAATISWVNATVTLTDVPMVPLSNSATGATAVTVAQTFEVKFSSSDSTDVSSNNGNLVKRCGLLLL